MTSEIKINPIGSIKIEGERFYLSIQDQYREALKGIEGFSHMNVVWWETILIHQSKEVNYV